MNEDTLDWLNKKTTGIELNKIRPSITDWRAKAVQVIAQLRGTNESAVVQWLLTQVLEAELNVLRGVSAEAKCPCCHRAYSAPATPVVSVPNPPILPPAPPPNPRLTGKLLDPPPAAKPAPALPQTAKKSHTEELQKLMSGGLKDFMD